MKRYSDEVPYEKRRYWYFTTHGYGPGTIPPDLCLLESREGFNKKGTFGDFICLDGILSTEELSKYDCIELAPPTKDKTQSTEEFIEKYLNDHDFFGMYEDLYEDEHGTVIIRIVDGDWKHAHLYLKELMSQLGYVRTHEWAEDSDSDCYTATHQFVKKDYI